MNQAKPMTKSQAVDYFRDDANWETVESVPSGDFLIQRLKGTDFRRILCPKHREFYGYGESRVEIPVSKAVFYFVPKEYEEGGIGFAFHGLYVSKEMMAYAVISGFDNGRKGSVPGKESFVLRYATKDLPDGSSAIANYGEPVPVGTPGGEGNR